MSDWDKDKWVALIKGVKCVLRDHVDHKEDQVNATDDGHDAEASERGCRERVFHSPTLTGSGLLVTALIERRPENKYCHKPPDRYIRNMLPVVPRNISLRE